MILLSIEGSVNVERLTDQNFIPLSENNKIEDVRPYSEFSISYVQIPLSEAEERMHEISKKKLIILYQSFGPAEYSLIGSRPEVPLDDVM